MFRFLRSLLTSSIITSIAFMLLGLAFIFAPDGVLTVLANTIAVLLIIYGVYGLVLASQSILISYSLNIGTSVIALILGTVLLLNNNIFKVVVPVVLGIFFVINSITKLRYSIVLKEHSKPWIAPMLISFALMFCGVLMLAHPLFSTATLMTFVGVLMVTYAVVDLIDAAFLGRELAHVESYMKNRQGGSRKSAGKIREAKIVDKKHKK